MARNTICLWYDKTRKLRPETFSDSAVGAVHRAAR